MSDRLHKIRNYYSERVHPRLQGFQILSWSSREAQYGRFQILLETLQQCFPPDYCPVLLDLGCGLAELAQFLLERGCQVDYRGCDITEKVLVEARRRTPGLKLECCDVFQAQSPYPAESFDVVFCSGIFNLELGNNDAFALHALLRMVQLSRHLAVANFLHRRTRRQFQACHYFDPDALLAGLNQAGIPATVREDYLENDFTIICQKPAAETTEVPGQS
ncbi:MAG: class I SAM-dependent methyltransferase [Lentisphaerae bacterium]|jgi:SAM-dependent methyltransferase|nr:class I SAM-dependent methyltransferase [Lentisphaerota bacterium]